MVDKLIDAGSGWLAISPGLTDRLMAEWGTKLRGPLYEYNDLNFWTNNIQLLNLILFTAKKLLMIILI